MDENDEAVGYRKPPTKNRFRKGQSGNPAGRPKKAKPASDLRSILERTAREEVEIGGQMRSMLELEIMSLQRKAAKGDVAASRHLAKLREQAGCDRPAPRGGVLVVPATVPIDEWSIAAARQQAKFRQAITADEDDLGPVCI